MPRAAPLISAFNSGQLSRTLDGRLDLDKYANGCKLLQNFVGLIQGPAQRRGGSCFVTEQKDSADRTWGIRFEFNADQAFVIEFGDFYVRFLRADDHAYQGMASATTWSAAVNYVIGDLVLRTGVFYYCILGHINQVPPNATYWYAQPGVIYEVPSPYAIADLTNADGTCALKTEQSGDVLYIANQYGTYPTKKLTRFADSTWTFTDYAPNQGPFQPENLTATTLQASAATGSITVTAGAALFASTDVGRLIRIAQQNVTERPWQTATVYAIGNLVRSNGKTYRALTAATSGAVPPTHEAGSAFDGTTGVSWFYIHSGYGVARITAFATSISVTATVIVDEANGLLELPADVVSLVTLRWRLGAWSGTSGYPRAVTFWRFRLWLTGRQKVWASVPNDFENHARDFFGRVEIDNAIDEQLPSKDVNDILWVIGADQIVFGTNGGEFVGDKITDQDAVGPGNFQIARTSNRRCRSVQPLLVDTSILYVQRAGRKLLSMDFDVEIEKLRSTDLAALANRITRGAIIDMAYQSEPDSVIWIVLRTGRLLGFTYDLDQNVTGWHYHPIGGDGFVESIVITPAEGGDRDELWISVKRTINGTVRRYWEYLKRPWEGADDDGTPADPQRDAYYVDSGASYTGKIFGDASFPSATLFDVGSYELGNSATVTIAFGDITYAFFELADEGKFLHFYLPDGRIYKVLIVSRISDSVAIVELLSDTPAEIQSVATQDFAMTTDTVGFLSHLEGETVQVLSDGAVHPDRVVTGGNITLQNPGGIVHAGLQMVSRLVPMRIEGGSADGTSQGKIKRVNKVVIRFVDTLGGKVGMFGQTLDTISRRSPVVPMGTPEPIFSEDVKVDMASLYETDGLMEIRQDQPLPMMVAAIMPQMRSYDP